MTAVSGARLRAWARCGLLLPVAVLAACDRDPEGASGSASSGDLVGVFVDAPVKGLKFKTNTGAEGSTETGGQFRYRVGDQIEFSYGGVVLGSVTAQELVTPLDLARAALTDAAAIEQRTENTLVLLQSLDSDAQPDNGIELRDLGTTSLPAAAEVDLDAPTETFAATVEDLVEAVEAVTDGPASLQVVDATAARAHFAKQLLGQLDGVWQRVGADGLTVESVALALVSDGPNAGTGAYLMGGDWSLSVCGAIPAASPESEDDDAPPLAAELGTFTWDPLGEATFEKGSDFGDGGCPLAEDPRLVLVGGNTLLMQDADGLALHRFQRVRNALLSGGWIGADAYNLFGTGLEASVLITGTVRAALPGYLLVDTRTDRLDIELGALPVGGAAATPGTPLSDFDPAQGFSALPSASLQTDVSSLRLEHGAKTYEFLPLPFATSFGSTELGTRLEGAFYDDGDDNATAGDGPGFRVIGLDGIPAAGLVNVYTGGISQRSQCGDDYALITSRHVPGVSATGDAGEYALVVHRPNGYVSVALGAGAADSDGSCGIVDLSAFGSYLKVDEATSDYLVIRGPAASSARKYRRVPDVPTGLTGHWVGSFRSMTLMGTDAEGGRAFFAAFSTSGSPRGVQYSTWSVAPNPEYDPEDPSSGLPRELITFTFDADDPLCLDTVSATSLCTPDGNTVTLGLSRFGTPVVRNFILVGTQSTTFTRMQFVGDR